MAGVTRVIAGRTALFDRLGGFDTMDRAVIRGFGRAAADPRLAGVLPSRLGADAAWQVQLFLTALAGGPMAYDGPDPMTQAEHLGLDAAQAQALLAHLLEGFVGAGSPAAAVAELREALVREATRHGLAGFVAPSAPPVPAAAATVDVLVGLAGVAAARLGLADRNLFVLDASLTLVHLDAGATKAVRAIDGDLRRAFNLGADELLGQPILRLHPAPTQFSALLTDPDRLPRETTWCFGRVVWKAHPFALLHASRVVGYGIAWRDLTRQHRAEAVFQRLRAQAEDLPVPVMFPDANCERWYGNAACEAALARLVRYLPHPVHPGDGVPVALFFPDAEARQALFADPAHLPHKAQVRFGPETVAVLVSPVLDQEQRYLGPQITWEIIHRTVSPPPAAVAAPLPQPPAHAAPAPDRHESSPGGGILRREARALETVSSDLLTLTRLLDAVADEAEQAEAPVPDPVAEQGERPEALLRADRAVAEALVAVRAAAAEAASAVAAEASGLSGEFAPRLVEAVSRAQASAETLRRIRALSAGLSELRGGGTVERLRAASGGAE